MPGVTGAGIAQLVDYVRTATRRSTGHIQIEGPKGQRSKNMTLGIAIAVYAVAMTLANLSVAAFGPSVTAINAFVLIGLDLALRDWLHVRLKVWQMGGLIAITGILTFLLNPTAGKIAVASAIAFTAAALVDWVTFARIKGNWMFRANGSNVAGAAVDSVIFPTIAFGSFMPQVVLIQFIAKVGGGALWALLINYKLSKNLADEDQMERK
jgi:uncharacterized PurR-regulated membrane protein YhhQ (DUF165 family)